MKAMRKGSMWPIAISVLCLTSLLGACTPTRTNSPLAMSRISAFKPEAHNKDLRLHAMQNAALRVGAQGALAWQSQHINHLLEQDQKKLDQIFDFRSMLLAHNVLPPILVEGRTELNKVDHDTLRLADQSYQIVAPPHFVTAPPTWRDYLITRFKAPKKPNDILLPRNGRERSVWNQYIEQGWQKGLDQANQIFTTNLNRLTRDMKGMILYRKLLAQNMVTPPYVAKTELGITGDDNHVRVNDRVLRITAISRLKHHHWKPSVFDKHKAAENE